MKTRYHKTRSLCFLCLVTLTGPATLPAEPGTPPEQRQFEQLDSSGNGYLSGSEITPEIRGRDTNRDGRIFWEEFVSSAATATAPTAAAPDPDTAGTALSPIPDLPKLAPTPGQVSGRAIFADGRAIPQFKVTALGWFGEVHLGPVGTAPNLGTVTAEGGSYAIRTTSEADRSKPVSANVISVYGAALINRDGKEFSLQLHPTDGKIDGPGEGAFHGQSGAGVVRDFVLLLSGPKRGFEAATPPRDTSTNNAGDPSFGVFYGGTISVTLPNEGIRVPEGAISTITLEPVGLLYDGSAGKTVVRTLTAQKPDLSTAYFRDIPLGDYTATLSITTPSGAAEPVRIRILGGDFGSSVPISFEPLGWSVSEVSVLSEG